jgi:hypothetical protein
MERVTLPGLQITRVSPARSRRGAPPPVTPMWFRAACCTAGGVCSYVLVDGDDVRVPGLRHPDDMKIRMPWLPASMDA